MAAVRKNWILVRKITLRILDATATLLAFLESGLILEVSMEKARSRVTLGSWMAAMVVAAMLTTGAPAVRAQDDGDADGSSVGPQIPGGAAPSRLDRAMTRQTDDAEAPAPVRRSAPQGKRLRVGVLHVENQVPQLPGNVVQSIESILITEATKRPEWAMLERVLTQEVLLEQRFSNSSVARPGTGPKKGRNLGAQLLIKGIVTQFTSESRGNGQGVSFGLFTLAAGGTKHTLGMDIRLIDAASGEVVASESKSIIFGDKSTAVALAGVNTPAFAMNDSKRSSAADAIRKIVNACLDPLVAKSMSVHIDTPAEAPWEGAVAQVAEDGIYIRGGADHDLQVGQRLQVVHSKGAIVDPDTGEVLGAAKSAPVATLEVVDVQEKMSTCRLVSGSHVAVKDRVRRIADSTGRSE